MSSNTQTRRPSLLSEALGPFWRRFAWAGGYFVTMLLVGTVGYRFIERWDWFNSFYMAVTTVSSVGFMEVEPLSPAGRAFTILLILLAHHRTRYLVGSYYRTHRRVRSEWAAAEASNHEESLRPD